LAPSPTGYLHLGHARSFLLAYWQARGANGRLQLRLEDLDGERCRPEFRQATIDDLAWLGLDWDGPIITQSEHLAAYDAAIADLEARGLLYACVCSRKDIQAAISAPHGPTNELYPGTCRGRFTSRAAATSESGRPAALRFETTNETLRFSDSIRGPQSCDVARQIGDFVVARRDGAPAYHLSVVVDDARFGVTHVVRGDDLLDSTSCQLLIYRALESTAPTFMHVPLVVDSAGKRLAKHHDALSLGALREAGVSAHAIVAWVAHSIGLEVEGEVSAQALVGHVDLSLIPSGPVTAPADAHALLASSRARHQRP
jgi:glutamyl-tRNA synthetase